MDPYSRYYSLCNDICNSYAKLQILDWYFANGDCPMESQMQEYIAASDQLSAHLRYMIQLNKEVTDFYYNTQLVGEQLRDMFRATVKLVSEGGYAGTGPVPREVWKKLPHAVQRGVSELWCHSEQLDMEACDISSYQSGWLAFAAGKIIGVFDNYTDASTASSAAIETLAGPIQFDRVTCVYKS